MKHVLLLLLIGALSTVWSAYSYDPNATTHTTGALELGLRYWGWITGGFLSIGCAFGLIFKLLNKLIDL